MRISKNASTALLALLAQSSASLGSTLRGSDQGDMNELTRPHSSCNKISEPNSCRSAKDESSFESCVWCECSAIPSECASVSQAEGLPEAVFNCDNASQSKIGLSYNFMEGITHSISDDEVDKNFCDASSPRSLSGYMDITGSKFDAAGEDKHLFYWFFEKRAASVATDKSIPFVVWLTGGPGCSSSLALLTENGPCSVNSAGDDTIVNPNSWIETAHMLWLDQPAGVGFSYGKWTDHNEEMVAEDAYYFLQAFFKSHPEYNENPIFIVGESYGGHYAPAIAHRVFKGNQEMKKGTDILNLEGVAVGNGLTDPKIQYQYYADMAYKNSHDIKTVSKVVYEAMTKATPKCIDLIDQCNDAKTKLMGNFFCQEAFVFCNEALTTPYMLTGLNPYDIREQCEVKPLCYDFSNVETFLNLDSTRAALHVTSKSSAKWSSCNYSINKMFSADWMADLSPKVADLLSGGIPVLIYAGDVDFICNYMGNRAWTLGLEWKHKDEFNEVEDHEWGEKAGLVRTSNGFTFLQVYDAGHMVPSDQPLVALNMITQFMNGESF